MNGFIYQYLALFVSNTPKWVEAVMIYLEPVLDTVWHYTFAAVKYIMDISVPVRSWIAENIPYCIDWVGQSLYR